MSTQHDGDATAAVLLGEVDGRRSRRERPGRQPGPAGAVFLRTARWFTRADAVTLAREILRLTEAPMV